jgi:hypothetical protein
MEEMIRYLRLKGAMARIIDTVEDNEGRDRKTAWRWDDSWPER